MYNSCQRSIFTNGKLSVCGANFKIEVYNPDTKEVIWYADEEFKHDSDVCEKCMAKKLKFSVYDKCDDTNFQKGLIIFHGKIIDEDFFKIHEIDDAIVKKIKKIGNCKCRIKKIECTCEEGNYPSDTYFVYKSCKDDLYFYVNDDFNYNPDSSGLTDEEQKVFELKSEIMSAGYKPSDTHH